MPCLDTLCRPLAPVRAVFSSSANERQQRHRALCACRYLTIYISDGCSPVNRLYYVDMDLLKKTAAGTVDFEAYKFASGEVCVLARGSASPRVLKPSTLCCL